jgi:glycosyltransferase involved in cell wall biosynthesis
MLKILVEGWRELNHSYSLVNQWQLLELKNYTNSLYHRDIPNYSNWNKLNNSSGLEQDQMKIIQSIPQPSINDKFDVTYRINFPYNTAPVISGKLFVFGTSEFQNLMDLHFKDKSQNNNFNNYGSIITPSNWSRIGFEKAGFLKERIYVVPHGVDPATFNANRIEKRKKFREALSLKENDFVLCSLGAMSENKGIDLLLEAFAVLKEKHKNLKLILKDQSKLYNILGKDLLNQASQKISTKYLTQNFYDSIGLISDNLSLQQIHGLYCASDLYVSPYRAEGFNLPALEAAASGTTILVTKNGSTDDYFNDCLGLRIESDICYSNDQVYLSPHLESLIVSINSIISDNKFNSLILSKYVHDRFSWHKVTKQLATILGL